MSAFIGHGKVVLALIEYVMVGVTPNQPSQDMASSSIVYKIFISNGYCQNTNGLN